MVPVLSLSLLFTWSQAAIGALAVAVLVVGWIAWATIVKPARSPLKALPGPPLGKMSVLGVLPTIMKEQTCEPQLRWVKKVRKEACLTRCDVCLNLRRCLAVAPVRASHCVP